MYNDPREEAFEIQYGIHPNCAIINAISDFTGKYSLADLLIDFYLYQKGDI